MPGILKPFSLLWS